MRQLFATRILGRIPFIFILLMVAAFFWLFGDTIFPIWQQSRGVSFSTATSYYIVLLIIFLIFSMWRTPQTIREPFNQSFRKFAIGFIITLLVMIMIVSLGIISQPKQPPELIIPMIIMMVAVVAPTEELMFRSVLLSYTGIVIQAILFALWHIVTYGAVWSAFGFPTWVPIFALTQAFVFGLILGFVAVRKELGVPACIGIHACYNLVVLGVIML